jgi:hypothetical protein
MIFHHIDIFLISLEVKLALIFLITYINGLFIIIHISGIDDDVDFVPLIIITQIYFTQLDDSHIRFLLPLTSILLLPHHHLQ